MEHYYHNLHCTLCFPAFTNLYRFLIKGRDQQLLLIPQMNSGRVTPQGMSQMSGGDVVKFCKFQSNLINSLCENSPQKAGSQLQGQ